MDRGWGVTMSALASNHPSVPMRSRYAEGERTKVVAKKMPPVSKNAYTHVSPTVADTNAPQGNMDLEKARASSY